MNAYYILFASILLQFLSTFLALRLVWITKKATAWIFIAIAIGLMSLRRFTTLYAGVSRGLTPDLPSEVIALAISFVMAVGLSLIGPLFKAIKQSE